MLSVVCGVDPVALIGEQRRQHRTERVIVLDDQNRGATLGMGTQRACHATRLDAAEHTFFQRSKKVTLSS